MDKPTQMNQPAQIVQPVQGITLLSNIPELFP